MRIALLPAIMLAVCVMTGTPGLAQPVALTCADTRQPLADRLCAALGEELRRRGHEIADGGTMRLTLRAHSPRPDMLLARLSVETGAAHRDGPELELSVMDRLSPSGGDLTRLAQLLLDQTHFSGK